MSFRWGFAMAGMAEALSGSGGRTFVPAAVGRGDPDSIDATQRG